MQEDPARARFRQHFDLRRALRALGDEVRLEIVHMLANGAEMKVTDLAATLLISQPLVSWHLSALRRAGIVSKRRTGREVYISLDLARYRAVVGQLGSLIEPASQPQPVVRPARSPAEPTPSAG